MLANGGPACLPRPPTMACRRSALGARCMAGEGVEVPGADAADGVAEVRPRDEEPRDGAWWLRGGRYGGGWVIGDESHWGERFWSLDRGCQLEGSDLALAPRRWPSWR